MGIELMALAVARAKGLVLTVSMGFLVGSAAVGRFELGRVGRANDGVLIAAAGVEKVREA